MDPIFTSQPGIFAIESPRSVGVPAGKLRVHVARIETYEIDAAEADQMPQFPCLCAVPPLMAAAGDVEGAEQLHSLLQRCSLHIASNDRNFR